MRKLVRVHKDQLLYLLPGSSGTTNQSQSEPRQNGYKIVLLMF